MRTQAKKKKAVLLGTETAKENHCQQCYPQDCQQSRAKLKTRLGHLLILLRIAPLTENQQGRCWRGFETTLNNFYQLERF